MIYTGLSRTGEIESVKAHGGGDIAEVYGGLNETDPIFYKSRTIAGTLPLTFKALGQPLTDYLISGNMVQNGTPTPEAPIYPQECGDIWNHWNRMLVRYYFGKVPDENSVSTLGNGAMFQIEAVPNVNYTVEQDSSPSTSILRIYRSNSPLVERSGAIHIPYDSMVEWDGTGTPKATINSGSFKYIWIQFGGTWYDSYGASATISLVGDYAVPLTVNGTTQNIYLSEPLRKIESYADSISSDGTVTRRIKKLVLTGEENIGYESAYTRFALKLPDCLLINVRRTPAFCTHYEVIDDGREIINIPNNSMYSHNIENRWYIKTTDYSTVDAFKSYLAAQYAAGTPVTVWYVLSVPITEQVTAPTITPATGSNTLAIGTTLQPSSVSITGHIKPTT